MSATAVMPTLLDQLLAPPAPREEDEHEPVARDDVARRLPEGPQGGDGPTLDEVVSSAWERLAAGHVVACPVCAGALAPRYGSGAAPVGARCRDCGSELT